MARSRAAGFPGSHWILFSPDGNRIAKIDDLTNEGEWYAYRDSDVAADFAREGDGPFTLTATYVQDLGIDAKVIRIDADGGQHNLLLDALSSVGATTDEAAATVETSLMGAWGEMLAASGAPDPRVSGLAQRERDGESSLQFTRNRLFDPGAGRFAQRDRMFFPGEDDGYSYSASRPLGLTDPTGDYWTLGTQEEGHNRWLFGAFELWLDLDLVVRPRGDWINGRVRLAPGASTRRTHLGVHEFATNDDVEMFVRASESATESTFNWWMGHLLRTRGSGIMDAAERQLGPMPRPPERSSRSSLNISWHLFWQAVSFGGYQAPAEVQAEPGYVVNLWITRAPVIAGGGVAAYRAVQGAATWFYLRVLAPGGAAGAEAARQAAEQASVRAAQLEEVARLGAQSQQLALQIENARRLAEFARTQLGNAQRAAEWLSEVSRLQALRDPIEAALEAFRR